MLKNDCEDGYWREVKVYVYQMRCVVDFCLSKDTIMICEGEYAFVFFWCDGVRYVKTVGVEFFLSHSVDNVE